MAGYLSESFTFQMGNINFQVERQSTEMFPGIEGEMILIEYEIEESEAGVCPAL